VLRSIFGLTRSGTRRRCSHGAVSPCSGQNAKAPRQSEAATTIHEMVSTAFRELANSFASSRRKLRTLRAYGRGAGVGRGRGVGACLGVGVGLIVAVGVAVGVAVAVGVGEGDPQGLTLQLKISVEAIFVMPSVV
jgi:hypothetical protein